MDGSAVARTRRARADELPRLAAAYTEWGYGGGIRADDMAFVAERDGAYVGIVRRSWESGVLMLRGMWVAPEVRGQGVGTQLLSAFVTALDADPAASTHACYGVPFAHLEQFYAQGGFAFVPTSDAPPFIQERMARYVAEGRAVAFMRRPAGVALAGPSPLIVR